MWQGLELGRGHGPSKKDAHIAAALDSLQRESWKIVSPAPETAPQ
jgi:dsRNA-specific ribonuclease